MFDYQFEWKNPQAGKVFVTGNFDNWQQVNELEKQPDGTFKKVIPLPSSEEKILYKFVVDGNWVIDNSMPVEEDGRGNQNNYINIPVEVIYYFFFFLFFFFFFFFFFFLFLFIFFFFYYVLNIIYYLKIVKSFKKKNEDCYNIRQIMIFKNIYMYIFVIIIILFNMVKKKKKKSNN